MSDLVFRRNLLALSRSDQSLGDRLLDARPDPALVIGAARSGAPVPIIRLDGRDATMHSMVDPEREAGRLEAAQPPGGFIVALGLGAGYLLKRYLASSATTGLLAVEYSAPLLRALLQEVDLSELFIDERFSLLLDPSPDELREAILSLYVPPLSGDIRSLPLRGRVDLDRASFEGAADCLKAVLGSISDDYSVQAFFGKLWFKNAVRNLFAAERHSAPLPPVRRAAVSAAGPSLEEQYTGLARGEGSRRIPHRHRHEPAGPRRPGPRARCGRVDRLPAHQLLSFPRRNSGRHPVNPGPCLPLDLMPARRFGAFLLLRAPFLRLRFGQVATLSGPRYVGGQRDACGPFLAEALGAETTLLAGADFSYPEGKSYARGTYIYGFFGRSQSRLNPLEALFSGFLFRGPDMERESRKSPSGEIYSRYLTKPLMAYREHLERFAARSPMEIVPLAGKGVEIRTPRGMPRRETKLRRVFAAGSAPCPAAEFLARYAKSSASPPPRDPAISYLGSLSPEQGDLWTTLLPSASAFQREAGPGGMDAASLLESTRAWAVETVKEALSEELPRPIRGA